MIDDEINTYWRWAIISNLVKMYNVIKMIKKKNVNKCIYQKVIFEFLT